MIRWGNVNRYKTHSITYISIEVDFKFDLSQCKVVNMVADKKERLIY